jgi:hypothetical protein
MDASLVEAGARALGKLADSIDAQASPGRADLRGGAKMLTAD